MTLAIILLAIAVCFCAGGHLPSGIGWAALVFAIVALLVLMLGEGRLHL